MIEPNNPIVKVRKDLRDPQPPSYTPVEGQANGRSNAQASQPMYQPTPQVQRSSGDLPAYPTAPNLERFKGNNYDDAINYFERQIKAYNTLNTPELEQKRRKREAARRMIAGIGDMGRAIANLATTTQYAPNAYTANTLSDAAQKRYDRVKAERDADRDRHVNYALNLGRLRDAQQQKDMNLTLNEYNMQMQHAALARQEADRQNKEARDAERWPLEKRKLEADAKRAEHNEILQGVRAGMEPQLLRAKIEKYYRGSRTGGSGRGGKYYGTLNGVVYRTKADYEKALSHLCDKYNVPVIEELEHENTYGDKLHRDVRRPLGEQAAEVERKTGYKKGSAKSKFSIHK